MPENNNTPETVQMNLAPIERNAGHTYNEHHEYMVSGSMKLILATWPKAKLDAQALNNVEMFRQRFGFEQPMVVRKQVLEIENKLDLTDREIRWLHHSGHLVIKGNEVKIKPARLMPLVGWMQLALFGFMYLLLGLQIAFSTAPAWKQALGEIAVVGVSYGVMWILNSLYIAPWRALKRSGALSITAPQG